jgi:hypothetical protein
MNAGPSIGSQTRTVMPDSDPASSVFIVLELRWISVPALDLNSR